MKAPTHRNIFDKIQSMLPGAMAADRLAARHEIARLRLGSGRIKADQTSAQIIAGLEQRLKASALRRRRRRENLPDLRFNEDLPIFAKKDEIIAAISRHPVIVVSGETGSGKTTQLPKFCLAAGRGIDGLIGCTQPRRIAATTVARRIAEELGQELGGAIGYKIRFKDRSAKDAYIKLMTDGILLAETQKDRYLGAYDTIIVDEAHERSLNIDFILGILQTLLAQRDDLKLIITSATIDTEKFSKAFGHAPVLEVSGRMYPVEVQYLEPQPQGTENGELTHVELAARTVNRILRQTRGGDMLVFMPTEQDIRETCELLEAQAPAGTRVMPLFARLSAAEQSGVFARLAERKVIVATNVAETSITIPGIKYVIDSGLARISRYSPRSRTTSLPVTPVSKSSCDQRKGRCGRVQNGICVRLFSEADYQTRPQFTPPEILRANLAEVILRMIALKLADVSEFPFIDRPDAKSIKDGFDLLFELGAITPRRKAKGAGHRVEARRQVSGVRGKKLEGSEQKTDAGDGAVGFSDRQSRGQIMLTGKGRLMAKIPLDPRLSRMVIEARHEGCLAEMAIIAAALSIQDPRERPAEKTKDADRMHATFNDPQSDFVTLLNVWTRYHDHWQAVKSGNQMKRFCREHFLSFKRMREWIDIHSQILSILKEQGMGNAEVGTRKSEAARRKSDLTQSGNLKFSDAAYEKIHKSVLSGFLSNIAQKKEKNIFRAARDREVMIFPGSGLFNNAGGWIVAAEMVETSRVFARTVANIDGAWLENLGGDLCRRTYLNPHWEKNRGEVVASEQVSLFGLIIVSERKVSYGKVNAEDAGDIFIKSALVDGDVQRPFAFMRHNRGLIDSITDIENRFRRRDLLVDAQRIFEFYQQRIQGIYDIRTLAKYLKQKGDDRFLRMQKEDLMQHFPEDADLARYPDRLDLGRHSIECSYRFEPGEADDGLTVRVPSTLAPAVPPETLDWLVPGLFPEKIEALIKGLPKLYRKKLVPVKDTVDIIIREMPTSRAALISTLADFIFRRFGVDIPASAWSPESLPDHLKMRIAVTAPDGTELRAGRDGAILREGAAGRLQSAGFEAVRKKWEKSGITRWDFGDLPEFVGDSDSTNAAWIAYPALEKDPATTQSVNLRLFHQKDIAVETHRKGVAALYAIHFARDLKFLKRQLVLPAADAFMADYFGGAKTLEKRINARVVDDLFAKNIRSEKDFKAHAETAAPKILSTGREWLSETIALLSAYHETRSQIYALQQTGSRSLRLQDFFQELTGELVRLVPGNFVDIYDRPRFVHLIRYIRAAAIRARRALVDFEKDQVKASEIRQFSSGLEKLVEALSNSASDQKRRAVEEYFWLIEEYKVSVFAQELKTAVPVSAKRLAQKLKQIERMV